MKTTTPDEVDPRRFGLAIAWLILFSIWFYSFGLPNNGHIGRWRIWPTLPFDLMDLVDPPVEPNAPAWGLQYLGQRTSFLMMACGVWFAAVAVGRLELRELRVWARFDRVELFFYSGCLGLATLSLAMLGLGLAGLLNRWLLMSALVAVCVVEACLTWQARPSQQSKPAGESPNVDTSFAWLAWIASGVIAVFVFCLMLGAMSPQTDFDVLEYHLGGPKEWYLQGRITRLPHNVYTSFPFLTEMLLLCGMVLYGDWEWGALAGQAVIAGFAPLTAIGLYATARRWFSASAGWLAALVWLTTPWAYRISIIAYAEGGLACYLFAAFAICLRIVWDDDASGSPTPDDSSKSRSQSWPLHLLCGLLAGSAMACKYTGLVSVVVPVGIASIRCVACKAVVSERLRHTLLATARYAVGVLIAVGPWLVKNAVETGNPVFPLAYSIFGGEGRDATMDAQWRRGHSSHYARPIDRLCDFPVKLTDVVANNDWHSALMFGLAPIALLASWRKKVWFVWAMIGWQFLAWFLFTHHIDRFYVPMFPIVALLAGCGAGWLTQSPMGRLCGGAVIIVSILFNAWIMAFVGGFNAGRMDLQAAADLVTSPSQKWLHQEYASGRLPRDLKVLCVGEAALFHAKFPYLYNTVFDRSLFEQWFAEKSATGELQLRPAEQIRETLRQRGVTHILVNWSEILRYREPGSYGYTDFAHPNWFAKLRAAGILAAPLPMPDQVSIVFIDEKTQEQVRDWAPRLRRSLADRPALLAVQVFPVQQ